MSYNPNFGMPPAMQGQFNFPGAPGTQQPIGQPPMQPGMQGPGPMPGAPGAPGATGPTAPPGTAGAAAGQQGLDPNMVKAILAMNGQDSARSNVEKQYALADQMRADAKSQVKGIQGQRVFTAPGWANALASVADNFVADRVDKRASDLGAGIDKQTQEASKKWYEGLTGKKYD